MGFIEYHEGCPVIDNFAGCFGHQGPYYTIFGTELTFLTMHIAISLILGVGIFNTIYILKKKGKIKLPMILMVLIPIIVAALCFFVLAYFFPVVIMY
jgi:uncharacterized membrane protein (UPF0182 family)